MVRPTYLELLVGQSEAAHLEESEHLQLVPGQAAGRHQLVRPGVRLHPNKGLPSVKYRNT